MIRPLKSCCPLRCSPLYWNVTNAVNKEHEFRVRIPFKCKIAFARVPPQSEFGRYIKNSFIRTALHHFQALLLVFLCFIIHSPPLKSKQIGRTAFTACPILLLPDVLFNRTCPCRFITLIRKIDNHIRIICTNRN